MYANINFQTKEELMKAVRQGKKIYLRRAVSDLTVEYGAVDIEGPWGQYDPLWTARVVVQRGRIIKVSRWEV